MSLKDYDNGSINIIILKVKQNKPRGTCWISVIGSSFDYRSMNTSLPFHLQRQRNRLCFLSRKMYLLKKKYPPSSVSLAVIGHSFNKHILKWQIQYGIFNYLSFIEMLQMMVSVSLSIYSVKETGCVFYPEKCIS
jgi:hypothetical protein